MSECYIVCEGYHDRAFWSGLLRHLECTDPGLREDGSRKPVLDPWGNRVARGAYGFNSTRGQFIRIVPAHGKDNVVPKAVGRLNDESKQVTHLVINVDADTNASDDTDITNLRQRQRARLVTQLGERTDSKPDGTAQLRVGETLVSFACWATPDTSASGIPNKQTLERLICASIVAVFPKRAQPIQTWLESRPDAPETDHNHKEHVFSYLAGWYADSGGYEGFCARIWNDEAIARELLDRLERIGVLPLAKVIAESKPPTL